ncbi:putative Monoglyceride lipase [Hypsibius exemplaris]|uniref:Monoglyceride lipase n=1 Tax=Hypsibius exemplaris TaxID=2072580 RepID=A0A1W0X6G6_HYPEX|nr:putative Monoglyceride lipase [Hypsibius exemplaris]
MDSPNERRFTGADGVEIYCRHWNPRLEQDESPRAIVFMCHGLFEYFGTDLHVAESLVKAGFLVCGHDHSGHGRSGGEPGQVHSLENYVTDVVTHVKHMKSSLPDCPVFLVGHSMGGAIALLAGLQQPQLFRGIILIGPLVVPDPEIATPTMKFVAKLLSTLAPGLGIQSINNDHLSRDRAVVERFNTDPLIFRGKISLRTGRALLAAVEKIEKNLPNITFPFLCIHGGGDRICSVQGAQALLDKSSSSDKTLSIYPGAYHRVQDEPDGVKEKCSAAILAWISERLD